MSDLFTELYYKYANTESQYQIIDEPMQVLTSCDKTKTYVDEIYHRFDDNIILFETTNYLKNILQSYKYNESKIMYQLELDFKRTSISVNNIHINDMQLLTRIFHSYDNYVLYDVRLDLIFIMLCLQSSFAFPYELLQKTYVDALIFSNYTDIQIHIDEHKNVNMFLNVCFKFNRVHLLHLVVKMCFDYENRKFDKYGMIEWRIDG